MSSIIGYFVVLIFTVIGILLYQKIAFRKQIIASVNHRSLHNVSTNSGAGIVLSVSFFLCLLFLFNLKFITFTYLLTIGLGGLLASFVGIFDDKFDISSRKKFLLQALLVVLPFVYQLFPMIRALNSTSLLAISIMYFVFYISIINLINFIDGIDGMLSSAVIFVSFCFVILIMKDNNPENLHLEITFMLLAILFLSFLIFNWPPAKIFMGDAGSIFVGFVFASLFVSSVEIYGLSVIWKWIIVSSYYMGDTITTNLIRILTIKKWYVAHRSHAYQNLARLLGSHKKVTTGILVYKLLIVFPMFLLILDQPKYEVIIAILLLFPPVILAIKFGPLYSSK